MEPFTWALVAMVASLLLTSLITPKQKAPKPSTLEDFTFPQVDEGTPQIVIFGDVWIEDWIVLYYGELETQAIKGGGGKK